MKYVSNPLERGREFCNFPTGSGKHRRAQGDPLFHSRGHFVVPGLETCPSRRWLFSNEHFRVVLLKLYLQKEFQRYEYSQNYSIIRSNDSLILALNVYQIEQLFLRHPILRFKRTSTLAILLILFNHLSCFNC